MKRLTISAETYSNIPIDRGAYKYAGSPEFRLLLLGYAFGDEPVRVIDLEQGEALPRDLVEALTDPAVEVLGYNSAFERICLSRYLGRYIPPDNWWCIQALARMYGLPGSLDKAVEALHLAEHRDRAGKRFMSFFCTPRTPTAGNGYRTRNLPKHAPDAWVAFRSYCRKTVEVERALYQEIMAHYTEDLEEEKSHYRINERINDRGVMIDRKLCESVCTYTEKQEGIMLARAKVLTGLQNPGSTQQLTAWLEAHGVQCPDGLDKAALYRLLKSTTDPVVKEVLMIHRATSMTSLKKYRTMIDCVCRDGKVHGVIQYYGAQRTGRYSGRLIQTQNLPRNHTAGLDEIRELVKGGAWDYLECMYDDVPDLCRQLIRTALIAPPGKVYAVSDYNAIEARVIAWLAGETWVLDAFTRGEDIYSSTAAKAFGVPVEKHGVNAALRQKGKVMVLALGYGGGVGAMRAMDSNGILAGEPDSVIQDMVTRWRDSNPHIVRFWNDLEAAVKTAIKEHTTVTVRAINVKYSGGNLYIQLPSGRWLTYQQAYIDEHGQILYHGTSDRVAWGLITTWGGKLAENVTQAVARDCLAESVKALAERGYEIVWHVHDEVIAEVPADKAAEKLAEMSAVMGANLGTWDKGLLHPAPGYTTPYYIKD